MMYPNQRKITVFRETVEKSKANSRPYIIAYHDNLIDAMNELTPAAFKVYLCMLFNTNGYKMDFSPAHFEKITGLCKDTIRKAINLLEKCGYIRSIDSSIYEFSENKKWEDKHNNNDDKSSFYF